MSDRYGDRESLLAEKQDMEMRRDACLVQKEAVPALAELAELERILAKQQAYRDSLGFFKGSERRRMDAQLKQKREEIADKKIQVELEQEVYDRQIIELGLGIQAIETELERLEIESKHGN